MKASIIIRTKNESKHIRKVLDILSNQTEKDFEIVIVDSGSTDETLNIIQSFPNKLNLKIHRIEPEEFTYPHACNVGAVKAAGDFLIYISGHSVPINSKWLENVLSNFSNEKVAGVYGPVYPLDNASIWEKIFYSFAIFKPRKKEIKKAKMGILGNTNAIIRKDLWQEYNFNEKDYSDGGEDGDWARHFLQKNYKIIFDPAFAVFHSHGLGLLAFIKQYLHWRKVAKRFIN